MLNFLFLRFKIVGQILPIDFPFRNKGTKIVQVVELAKIIFDRRGFVFENKVELRFFPIIFGRKS